MRAPFSAHPFCSSLEPKSFIIFATRGKANSTERLPSDVVMIDEVPSWSSGHWRVEQV